MQGAFLTFQFLFFHEERIVLLRPLIIKSDFNGASDVSVKGIHDILDRRLVAEHSLNVGRWSFVPVVRCRYLQFTDRFFSKRIVRCAAFYGLLGLIFAL